MLPELYEYKSTTLGTSFATKGGSINLDEAQGMVECFVAGIGNKDSVGDIVTTGAFTKSLQRRKPRVVWGHNWNDPIGKVLEIYEVPNTDPRLPLKMKMAGIGGLFARVQFNLNSEKGKEAFAMVAFFGEEQEWSIGYKTLRAQFDQKSQANVIYELELYEVSPVLHGANQLTGTISVKSEEGGYSGPVSYMEEDEEETLNRAEIEKQLGLMLGAKVSLMDVNGEELTFARRTDNGEVGRYKCHFTGGRGRYMFGAPEPITVVAPRRPAMPMPGMPTMPVGSPGIVMNQPQRPTRPPAMSMPVAIRPGQNGPQIIALPAVEYEDNDTQDFDPNNLDKEEADLRDALLKITKRHGKFNQDSEGVWAGYTPAAENSIAGIGVKCANCVFYQGGDSCKIIDMEVESEGKCRFAVIPNGVVKGDSTAKKTYEIEDEFGQEDYVADLEVKYPGELAVAALRGAVGRRRQKRRKFKLLSEFGSQNDWPEEKAYLLPVVPKFAFMVKQALDPIFDYHGVESFVDVDGIVMTSGISYDLIEAVDTAVDNLKKKSINENDIEWKAASYRLGRAIGGRLTNKPNIGGGRSAGRFFTSIGAEDFDPFTARDANLNGIVGEGLFLRGVLLATPDPTPDGPGSIRNPKPSRAQVRKPESEILDRAGDGKVKPVGSKLSSGKLFDVPNIDDPDVDSAAKYGSAESQRDELQGVLDGASDKDQIKRLKQAISELDKYMARVEKMAEGEMADKEKPKKKPKAPQVLNRENSQLSRGRKPEFVSIDGSEQKLSSGYAKYLNTPESKRKDSDRTKYDGPLSKLSSGSTKEKTKIEEGSKELQDIYDAMAKQIVEALQELANNPNAKTWDFPWRNPEMFARNPTTKRIYQGMNQLTLTLTGNARGYKTNRWAGESQWKKYGGKLKPGAKSRGVSVLVPREGYSYEVDGREAFQNRFYEPMSVYNVEDVLGLPERFYKVDEIEINNEERIQDLESVIKEIGPQFVESKGSQAFYRPSTDKIHMPAFEQFKDALYFYGTAMHETVHWTSHPTRLNRELGGRFGDEKYAFEELVAEIGASFAMGTMGLEPVVREDHLLYLGSWIKKLQTDPSALHRAILQAQQANDYLLNRSATMRRLAGIPDAERKGKVDSWFEVPMLAGYEDAPNIKPTTTITGTMEDLLDVEMDGDEDFISQADKLIGVPTYEESISGKDIVQRGKSGAVIDSTGRLSSGKASGPIKPVRGDGPEIERSDSSISFREVYKGMRVEPTQQQRDIIDAALHLILNDNNQIMAINAGAGTGKTTTLKSIALALASEFSIAHITDDEMLSQKLKHLSEKYDIDFDGLSRDEIQEKLDTLRKSMRDGEMYYAVFGKKNQKEAENDFPSNTGTATTSKIFWWSLALGQGDERFGKNMRRKMQALKEEGRRDNRKPKGKPIVHFGTHYDGSVIPFEGRRPGWEDLGWRKLRDGKDWIDFLQEKKVKGAPQKDDVIALPTGANLSATEFGDLLKKALRRWALDPEEKVSGKHFELSRLELEQAATSVGLSRKKKGQVSLVDSNLKASEIPQGWIDMVQSAVDSLLDGDSNLLPSDELAKMWMLTSPDLRSDPGLISHSSRDMRNNVWVPKETNIGDTISIDGKDFIVVSLDNKKSDRSGNKIKAKLTKRFGTKKPISAFLVDEAQDMNPIVEKVLEDNRDKVAIVLVGDERQSILGFQDAKDILSSMEPEYQLEINESFRYGEIIAYLANIALARANAYRASKGEEQLTWKHVKGLAGGVVEKDFSMMSIDGSSPLSGDALQQKISYLAFRYPGDEETILSMRTMSEKDRIKTADKLRDKYKKPARGEVVDAAEMIKQGILPDMILTRSNAEIAQQAVMFAQLFTANPKNRRKDGTAIIPDIVIPATKHEEMLTFMKHLAYIKMPEDAKKRWEAMYGKPKQSKIIGPVWTVPELQRRVNQNQNQQLRTFYKLVTEGNAARGIPPINAIDFIKLLEGSFEYEEKDGKRVLSRVIPPTFIPERDTYKLSEFLEEIDDVRAVASREHSATGPNVIKGGQLAPYEIIPADKKNIGGVHARLMIDDLPEKPSDGAKRGPGKWNGKIVLSGQGLDTARPTELPDGTLKALDYKRSGPYRRDLEKIIDKLNLGDKVQPVQDSGMVTANNKAGVARRNYDGFVIDAGSEEENVTIMNLIANELRKAAEGVGGDVEITTATLAKGREADFVVIASDFADPDVIQPIDSELPEELRGTISKTYMEELNLVYVALTRAKKYVDPGDALYRYYLSGQASQPLKDAIERGDLDKEMDLSGEKIFPDSFETRGQITNTPVPDENDDNPTPTPDGITPSDPDPIAVTEDNENFDDLVVGEDEDESSVDPTEDERINDVLDDMDEEKVLDSEEDYDGDYDDEDGSDGQMRLSSGTSNYPGPGRRLSRRMGVRSSSRVNPGAISAQDLAGIRLFGDPNSARNRRLTDFAMQTWAGFRERGIEINAESKDKTKNAMMEVGKAMKARQNRVRVGRVGDNLVNDSPSAETWMLSVDVLAEQLRIPEEVAISGRVIRARSATRQEIASLLGLSGQDKQRIENPDAGINHDAVRLLVAELGNRPELAAWRYFAPVSRDEIRKIIPSPTGDTESITPEVDMAMENAGRANMRDRFIIETFGKDAFPHWFDQDEGEAITPDEYSKLGEVDERAKFRATGRFAPDDPFEGDSEAEIDLYGQSFDELMNPPSLDDDGEALKLDKTDKKDFEIEPLLEYLGIDKSEWKTKLRGVLAEKFETENIGDIVKWSKDGIPTANIAHMIRKGVIPSASDVWKEGKVGQLFDAEMERPKYAVYEALNEFIDRSFPTGRLNTDAIRSKIVGATDMRSAIQSAVAARGSAWNPKKGTEPRFAVSEMQTMVDRFNEIFGTNHTLEDIFSAEQLRNAKERIESGETLWKSKRTPKTGN
jgi:HK97 family phage prohead protease